MRGSKNPNPSALERTRREVGFTRKKLAELSGVSFRSIEGYEQGKDNINSAKVNTIKALAQALGVPMEKILDEE